MDLHRLAEERSLAFHREVAERLRADPSRAAAARARVRAWRAAGSLHSRWIGEWERVLDGPLPALFAALVADGERARALRQVTPFAGFLDARERWRIWREVRERAGAAG